MATSQPPTADRIEINVTIDGEQSAGVDASTTQQTGGADVPMGVVIQAVSGERRRRAVQELASTPTGKLGFGEVTDRLARKEYGEDFDADERKRIYVSLYQTHLPKLDDLGLIDMDDDRGTITASDGLDEVAAWLDESRARFGGDA